MSDPVYTLGCYPSTGLSASLVCATVADAKKFVAQCLGTTDTQGLFRVSVVGA
jgi:hypothetical protein